MARHNMSRRWVAEFLGTALLLALVVGSGIMAERLSGGNVALALLANTLATGAGLIALILTFAPISGAHFNPIVTLAEACLRQFAWRLLLPYWLAQITGAIVGVWLTHAMFELPLWQLSQQARTGNGQWLAEGVASFGLIAVIISTTRHKPTTTPFAVAAFITAACWFTASSSFANPAVTLARALTDSFAGIRLVDVLGFMMAQVIGAMTAVVIMGWLLAKRASPA